ncbi:fluoride efflux transporter FluC [Nonomuraea muscovyensis]|uniref:Fluoride-specific ion channel FluC n=1 Tax=Nonomuraea muscovyensis TaxID=1124761 RepID=A0A7X0EY63_9ACTN|nr:CrcB family protein [Nonomuraea muscovyensis]MBB6346129.1 CrcB protein [Nonomuraea muscovyensis]
MTEPVDPTVDLADARRRRRPRGARYGVPAVIAAGGAIGAGARYGAALLWPTATGSFPWTTLGVNASGCLLIGILMVTMTEATPVWVRPFFGTGVLGGYTTFSTYCVDIEHLVAQGRPALALVYLAATPVAALAAVTAGALATRRLLAMKRTRGTP